MMKKYTGTAMISGIAVGPIYKLGKRRESFSRVVAEPEIEISNLEKAIWTAKTELLVLSERAPAEEEAIFIFQHYLLEDKELLKKIKAYIQDGMSSAQAMETVGKEYSEELANSDNEYLRLRAVDILDAAHRVVDILDGRMRNRLQLDAPSILAADVFMPSDLFSAPAEMILGIACSRGSSQSHAAIIARSLGIPAVIELGDDFINDCEGKQAVLDARTGDVVLNPNSQTRQIYVEELYENQRKNEKLLALTKVPNYTKNGVQFTLFANCHMPADIKFAVECGAEGIGLLRTESLLYNEHWQNEEKQFEFYCDCLKAARDLPVTFRTFDIDDEVGASFAEGFSLPFHALGMRGIRLGQAHPRIMETQLCALLRASAFGNVRILFPLISSISDWIFAKHAVERCKELLKHRKQAFNDKVEIGMIFETPAACLCAEDFTNVGCDFFCVGTNDLIQYTHAADRQSSRLDKYYEKNSAAVKKLVVMAVNAAKSENIPVYLTGMAISSPAHVVDYVSEDLSAFSFVANQLLEAKEILLQTVVEKENREVENV